MAKKKKVNKQFWTVAILTVLFHFLLLVVLGGVTLYHLSGPSEAEFVPPPPVERLELRQLEYLAQIDRLQSMTATPQVREMSGLQDAALDLPSLNLDNVGPVMTGANVRGVGGAVRGGTNLGGRSLGFGAQAIEFLGVRATGERIIIVLETSREMLELEKGGIEAFAIIKEEAIRLITGLPTASLFNVFFTDNTSNVRMFSRNMLAATPSNKQAVSRWLEPINTDLTGRRVGATEHIQGGFNWSVRPTSVIQPYYGRGTGRGRGILHAIEAAFEMQADVIYMIAADWPPMRPMWTPEEREREERRLGFVPPTDEQRARYRAMLDRAQQLLDEENRRRLARGEPARVVASLRDYARERNLYDEFDLRNYPYTPAAPRWTGRDVSGILSNAIRTHYDVGQRPAINVILFGDDSNASHFRDMIRAGHGSNFRVIADGAELERIRSRSR